MRTMIILGLLLCFATCAIAVDFQTVSEASIKVFLQAYPQYKALLEKYGQEVELGQPLPVAVKYTKEIEVLFSKFGMSMEDFAVLTQKISTGFASAQMEQAGMQGMFGSMAMQMGSVLKPEETAVIKKYLPQIEAILTQE